MRVTVIGSAASQVDPFCERALGETRRLWMNASAGAPPYLA